MSGPHSIKRLADRFREVSKTLGDRADDLTARVDRAEAVGHSAFDRHSAALDAIESGIREIEDMTGQLSNGGPPLEPSDAPPDALPDAPPGAPPGVTLHSPRLEPGNGVKLVE